MATTPLPPISKEFQGSTAFTHGDTLVVSTGEIMRRWVWNGYGLVTVDIENVPGNVIFSNKQQRVKCDWNLWNSDTIVTKATIVSMTAAINNDEGFTNQHLEVVTHLKYESLKLELQHIIWVFPNSPGIRTQLKLKALPGFDVRQIALPDTFKKSWGSTQPVAGARAEFLPLNFKTRNSRRYWGYYNDPGNRHNQSMDMLREEVMRGFPLFQEEFVDWASGIGIEYDAGSICVVKESNKCVNQQGHYTGSFFAGPQGLASTGLGLLPGEITSDRFRECWANWTVVYEGGNDNMQLAVKRFDRARYPFFPERDLNILSNTWGPANPLGDQFTREDFLLKEIPALANLGVEVMQIDDGWQRSKAGASARDFRPVYTQGWTNIKQLCDKNGLKLGLWVSIRNAELSDLKNNLDELGYISWKADFDHLASRMDFEERNQKYREVMKYAWMKTQFTLCPEYDDPRYGWYYAKEYGSIFFQNVQEGLPEHLTMVPYHVLRQHWLMTKYFNSNKLQVMLQNPKRTNPELSDAFMHSHSYCFAMGLPFIPVFFQSAQLLDDGGKNEIRELISLYKKHRLKIAESFTFPIGDMPSNDSWTGFEMIDPQMEGGYLLVFREINNQQKSRVLQIKFLEDKTVMFEDLFSGKIIHQEIDHNGMALLTIDKPASFLFLKFRVISSKGK